MNVTLYTVLGKFERIEQAFLKNFQPICKGYEVADTGSSEQHALRLRLQDDSYMVVHINHGSDFIAGHIGGMHNFFSGAPLADKALKESALNQIAVFNCVIGCEFDTDDNDQRTDALVQTLFLVAQQLNALVLFESMRLYTGDGDLLISIDGETELTEYTPVGNADFLDKDGPEPAEDAARRKQSIAYLRERGIPFLETLPVVVWEQAAQQRSKQEIAERLFAMFAVCVYSEALGGGQPRAQAQRYPAQVDTILSGRLEDCLTPREQRYLANPTPTPEDIANFGWRYEGCLVLLFALGFCDELPYPDSICDVGEMAKLLWQQQSLEDFLDSARCRPLPELLDMADLTLRMDWACVDARVKGGDAPAGLDTGVVYERHYAFNWLVGACGGADWDDIQADT